MYVSIKGACQAYKCTQQSSEVHRRGVGDKGKRMKGPDDNGCIKSKQEQTASVVAETMIGRCGSSRTRAKCRQREKTEPGIALTWVLDCAIQPPELCVPSGVVHRVLRTPSVEKAREQAAGRQTAA